MTRAQRLTLVLAGLLIAARLFVPVSQCTGNIQMRTPVTSWTAPSYQLPRFVPWNYGPFFYPPGYGKFDTRVVTVARNDIGSRLVMFPKPSLLKRIVTLDPGVYVETNCQANYTQHTLFDVTLLHALGLATLAGVLFVVLPPLSPGGGK